MKAIVYVVGILLGLYVGIWVCFVGGWVTLLGLAVTVFQGGAFSTSVCAWGLIKAFGGGLGSGLIWLATVFIGELVDN